MSLVPRRIHLFIRLELVLISLPLQSQSDVVSQQIESNHFVFYVIDFFERHLSSLITWAFIRECHLIRSCCVRFCPTLLPVSEG